MFNLKCPQCERRSLWIDGIEKLGAQHVAIKVHCMVEECGHEFGVSILQCSDTIDVIGAGL